MSVITTLSPPTIETFSRKYPDVPKEVILKEDLLRQGLCFSPAALARAKNSRPQAYFLFSYNMRPLHNSAALGQNLLYFRYEKTL